MKPKPPYPSNTLVIVRNNDYAFTLIMKRDIAGVRTLVDMSSAVIKAQCRERKDLDSPLLFQFGVSVINITPEEEGADPVPAGIVLSIDHGKTRSITAKTGYWDMMIIQGDQRTFIGGPVIFEGTVTDELI